MTRRNRGYRLRRRLRKRLHFHHAVSTLTGDESEYNTPALYSDRASFAASEDPQKSSLLLAAMPPEVRRLIYGFMWLTGPHVYGIHLSLNKKGDRMENRPCLLGYEESWVMAGANAKLDATSTARGAEGGQRVGLVSQKQYELWVERTGKKTHLEYPGDGVGGARNAARYKTGADPRVLWSPVLWSPFLPVLLTCKKV
ncbi:hypothetical protein IMZ48_01640 [Candidatus Bathyarchaeota archaeon]|nr:hypothetical protein [Candidatus Bathyarchaeota archaeon]